MMPENYNPDDDILTDREIMELEDYYGKPINQISQEEIENYQNVCFERANNI